MKKVLKVTAVFLLIIMTCIGIASLIYEITPNWALIVSVSFIAISSAVSIFKSLWNSF